jgi:hypothetical protein
MKRKILGAAIAGAVALCGSLAAPAQEFRYDDQYVYRLGRASDWNINAETGSCHLRISVDDRASVQLRGDQIIVNTRTGRRSFDEGSVCTQPLPFHRVEDFRIVANEARGRIVDVRTPDRRNNFTGGMVIEDPQPGAATYDLVVSWRNVERPGTPLVSNDPFPYFDETRACQERVRSEFLTRNEGDAYLEFTGATDREDAGANRERIRGRAFARNRNESRMLTYECVLNERNNRVLSATYDLRGPARYSSIQ